MLGFFRKDENMKKKSLKNMSMSNRIFYIFNSIFWVVIMLIVLYPLYLVCISSISDPDAIARGEVIWHPVDISMIGYEAVFENREIWMAYGNSLLYTVSGVCISIFVTLAAAYAISRRSFPGKKLINLYFVVTMFFSGGMIPTFLVMRDIGLYNTRLILIIMGCVSVWNMMVARTYIQSTIPEELYEAAVLDGSTHFQYFGKVVMPLSKTIIAVLMVYYGVAKWNDYFSGLVYIRDRKLIPLQTLLKELLATLQTANVSEMVPDDLMAASMEEAMRIANVAKYCIIVISTVPVVLLYMFLQKYFEKGVMIGSLKG